MYTRRKVFSLLQDSETGEEKYFSTTNINLEDAEERIFSINEEDEAEEREFARKDYEGLTEAQKRLSNYQSKKAAEKVKETPNLPVNITKKEKDLIETTSKKSFKLGKKGKVALGIAGGTALAAGALYGAKKLVNKKKDKK